MVTFIKKTLFLALLLLTFSAVWGQTVKHTPGINLQIAVINAASVRLTWVSPPQAIGCELKYKTHYDSTIYNIPGFASNSTVVPRANPTGPEEVFTIDFTLANGDVLRDITIYTRQYGGLILIEDDIFAPSIIGDCNHATYNPSDTIYFIDLCVFVESEVLCNFNNEIMGNNGFPNESDPGWEAFLEYYEDTLHNYLLAESTPPLMIDGVCDCSNENVLGGDRYAASTFAHSPTHSLSPNPFHDRLILKTLGTVELQEKPVTITVMNVYGKVVYVDTQARGNQILQTESWASGMYTVSISQDSYIEVYKMIKY
ncbi:MAG: T9SS type A sorting domain-containing protein [Bacteroidia bacterium]